MNQHVAKIINDCIEQEEGGWKLSKHPDDPDGGWTYAGVTSKTYNSYKNTNLTYAEVAALVAPDSQYRVNFNDDIINLYHTRFYGPLNKAGAWYVLPDTALVLESDKLGFEFNAALFSCSVNRGVANAIEAWKEADRQLTLPYKMRAFICAWQDQYTKLVADNAAAWRKYAEALEDVYNNKRLMVDVALIKPKAFRATFLQGWINRTQRFM